MSDIVERLRAQQFKWGRAGYKCLDGEAADEIERLRGRLRDVVEESMLQEDPDDPFVIAKVAGYVRCERCDGNGFVRGDVDAAGVPNDCDCFHGWRPRDD